MHHEGMKKITRGEKILALREARGWSKEQLGVAAGVSRQTVHDVERDHAHPTMRTIEKIARALKVSVSEIV